MFSLIGPKRYDAPWKDIENQGWIAPADCIEVRVTLTDAERMAYATAEPEDRYRLARHGAHQDAGGQGDRRQASRRARCWSSAPTSTSSTSWARNSTAPVIQGSTKNGSARRCSTRSGAARCRVLVVSKVANFSIDLPEAAVAVQVSGTFGSRQEEAQRLGRVLRPKADGGRRDFYTVVARDTLDAEYAAHRQRFLAEQGYAYTIVDADDLLGPAI